MENNTYIQILGTDDQNGTRGYIYLEKGIPATMTFSIADVQDINKKNSTYSKTIEIPGTKNNNQILGNLFHISATDYSFDINQKQRCIIYSNGVPILNGAYIQLLEVNRISKTSDTGDEHLVYTALIFDNRTSLFDSMSEALLSDLDFSQYNHALTPNNIFNSSGNTWEDAYKYFLPFKNSGIYYPTDFQPAVFAKAYWDKIMETNGYSYEGFPESEPFTKLLIPYNGDTPKIDQEDIDALKFRSSITSSTVYNQTRTAGNPNTFSTNDFANNNLLGSTFDNGPFVIKVPFNDDSSGDNYDSGGTYNAATQTWTSSINGTFDLACEFEGTFRYSATTDGYRFVNDLGYYAPSLAGTLEYKVVAVKNASSITPNNLTTTITDFNSAVIEQFDGVLNIQSPLRGAYDNNGPDLVANTNYDYPFIFDVTFPSIDLNVGDTVDIYLLFEQPYNLYYDTGNQALWIIGGGTPVDSRVIASSVHLEFDDVTVGLDNRLENFPHQANMQEGQAVKINNYIPKQTKQKDFVSSLTKMFNLYIEQDVDNEKHLIVKTRNDYYSGSSYVDWTEKFEDAAVSNVKFLSELQNKRINFTYKEDKDVYNVNYKEDTQYIYGQKYVIFDNEYLIGEKKIEPIFSPTPLVYNDYLGTIVPYIDSQAPKCNIRILYDGGMIDGGYKFETPGLGTVSKSSYPFAGHYNHPTAPTVDLDWASNEYMYVTATNNTTNNLYETYWQRYISQIATGKMLTAYFNLNPDDIATLDLSKRVFIRDNYYYINRIIDYDFVNPGLTKVELLKVDEGLQNLPDNIGVGRPSKPTGEQQNQPFGPNVPTTDYQEPIIESTGDNKVSTKRTGVVAGTGNTITGTSSKYMVTGEDNFVNGKGVTILSSKGNTVTLGAKNVTIISTNNKIITDDNVTFVNDVQFKDGTIMPGYNDIDSGLDVVLNPFYTSTENDIDSGQDVVRGIKGNSPIQDLDSREDNANA